MTAYKGVGEILFDLLQEYKLIPTILWWDELSDKTRSAFQDVAEKLHEKTHNEMD